MARDEDTPNDGPARSGCYRPQTELIRGGQTRSPFNETSEALYLTSGYVYSSAEEAEGAFTGEMPRFVYSRYANPTVAMFEERLRRLEGAEACFATATGMSAVFAAMMCQLRSGMRVVASRVLFGSCHYIVNDILPRFGVETEFVDGSDTDAWAAALERPADIVFLETPANPTLEIVDLGAVCEMAHKAGACVVIDNVFASPVLQRPLEFGADVVVYSATKHIDGQGRALGGAVLGSKAFIDEKLFPFAKHTGPSMSPFNAWLMLKGLETLDLRVQQQCDNAQTLADFLDGRPGVRAVRYPGRGSGKQADLARAQMKRGGTIVALEVERGKEGAFAVLNRLQLIDISNNLGDAKTLATHPATTTHQRVSAETRREIGIADGLIRFSVGLEDVEDLKDDLAQALAGVR
ncbi:O-succinylhomoserine sulfhydrylase [Rhodovibrio salinarum]|uniref:O-succinylhomoserine sulfhydrylase n=1 Tax=Rhodovibrio salinarum TaxID=1087 RepID=A0A934V0T0_9PROT|nr:O-succinylhomoserine sulfhydrylase [Rhodovibrio salinarum]MBK1698637.1 O-succinylhomoserine sulfhydrylase [Rhodovibrio salinarum]